MLRLHALAYVCDPTPISTILFPLPLGVQLKITANFCKWRWRRLKCCMRCMRRHPEGRVCVCVGAGQWRFDFAHTNVHTRTVALAHTHSSRGIMMALSQSSELAFVGIVGAQIFVDNGCENWRRVIAFAPCPTLYVFKPPLRTHNA